MTGNGFEPSGMSRLPVHQSKLPRVRPHSFWSGLKHKLAPVDFGELIEIAMRRTHLDDFGEPPFEDALRTLVDACNTEAGLNLFGRFAARQHMLDLLETRLRLVDYWRQTPEIRKQAIHRPLFITGMPRSGSTFLHDLLAQDPDNRVPLTWEVMFPLPVPRREGIGSDPRIRKAENRLRWLLWTRPSIVKAHPIGARLPQECVAIMSYSFQSDEFLCTFRIPSYENWLRTCDLGPAYGFHRRFLQHLQWLCPGERWVLKAPDHVHALPSLLGIYPDARIVFLHRDPLKVLGSVASLTKLLLDAFGNHINARQVGADEARILVDKAVKIMEFQDRNPSLADRFINVRYLDLIRDPIATVQRIYERFGVTLSADTHARMRVFLGAERRKGRAKHIYRLADFGLDPNREKPRFAAYYERFTIECEPSPE
jgi:hypothetical protein